MNTSDINKQLKYLDCFIGTFARDTLPNIKKFPAALVINTDPVSKPGEHWVSNFINKNGDGEYFDSYGFQPLHKEIMEYLNKYCAHRWCYSTVMLQSINSMTCGYYCIIYIKTRCLGYSYCNFITLFSNQTTVNDLIVSNILNEINK